MLLQESGNAIRRLCALANPVVYALEVNPQILLVLTTNRIKKANTLKMPAIPTITRIGNNQVIERTLFRASARKSNTNHYISVLNSKEGRHALTRADPSRRRIVRILRQM